MNQLQDTPDFINKVSNLKGSASRPADHQLWASYKLHLILTTKSPNWKGLPAGRPWIMKQLQATPDFNDKVSKLERSAGRPTLNYETATSYTWFWWQSLQIERVCQPADHQLRSSYKLHLISSTQCQIIKGRPAGRLTINYEPATSYTWF